jgi:Dolichyl-phosphate-mannose-protein mannosyltransferase
VPLVIAFALLKLLFHIATNGQYGFHRDELQLLADARHLDWGFVAYPPLTALFARIELALFGTSLTGFRFFAALAQSVAIVVSALIAKHLGGGRFAQFATALAVAICPVSLAASSLMEYVALDTLWWILLAYFLVRLIESDDARWWLGIGAAIGLGVETKYAIAFFVAGVVVAVLVTPLRRHLRSPWLWAGAALSLAIAAPNLVWLARNHFISIEFLQHIHTRDVRIGRAQHFLLEQLWIASNPVTVPLWIIGLIALWRSRFRAVAIAAVVTFALFWIAQGRGYYTAALYAPLLAAGCVWVERTSKPLRAATIALLVIGAGIGAFVLPLAPPGTRWFRAATDANFDLREEIGWPELTAEVARIYRTLPPGSGIFANNYGEAGAIELYGPKYGLPQVMSGTNSFWYRTYPASPPPAIIVLGDNRESLSEVCHSVALAGRAWNPWNIKNEETLYSPDIFVCRGLKMPWKELWPKVQHFG